MEALQLLTTLRAIANDTITACNRQEYKTGFIFQIHNDKVQNINDRVAKDVSINRAVKSKYFAEIRKMRLDSMPVKDYVLIRDQLNSKLLTLSPAVEFMKKR